MWKRGISFQEALSVVREKRGFIDPNLGFVGQLMEFEKIFKANHKFIKNFSFTGDK
jgi:hypothetical protein